MEEYSKDAVTLSKETLYHFRCKECDRWWSIADPPEEPKELYCPWCGVKQNFEPQLNTGGIMT